MERLNYNQLFYFYVVASEGSVKRACEKLHLTQPTISGQIKILEEDLGFDLFIRKHRKLVLSRYGEEVLKKAEKIFSIGEDLLTSLPGKGKKHRNEMRLGVVQTVSPQFLYTFSLKAWKDPTINIQIRHGDHDSLLKQMDSDKVDLIISDTPISPSVKRYKTINIYQESLTVVGSEKFKGLKKGFPQSLNDTPYLSFGSGGQVRSEIEYFFKVKNIKPDYIGSVDDLTLMERAASEGFCITVLPVSVAKKYIKGKSLFKIGDFPDIKINNWLIMPKTGSKKLMIHKLINSFLVKKRS